MPTFFAWYQYYADSEQQDAAGKQLYIHTPLVIRGTDKNKQLTIIKPTQTGINCNKWTFWTIKSLESLKNTKISRVP